MYSDLSSSRVDHEELFLTRLPEGGFLLEAAGKPAARARVSGAGWKLEGPRAGTDWLLGRATATACGFVLTAGETEIGRTMPLVGTGGESGLRYLMLEDGQLFRIVRGAPRADGFELLGWEAPGAYLRARPEPEGWRLAPTVAASGLRDIRALSILLAAEVLEAEEPLVIESRTP